mmetsp:Transcript_29638/g.81119  ORF Transcript_29638/g.81119 Transcript_29638/m.81119 type:complete len:205 (+) Transcript_29638:260-874(+)
MCLGLVQVHHELLPRHMTAADNSALGVHEPKNNNAALRWRVAPVCQWQQLVHVTVGPRCELAKLERQPAKWTQTSFDAAIERRRAVLWQAGKTSHFLLRPRALELQLAADERRGPLKHELGCGHDVLVAHALDVPDALVRLARCKLVVDDLDDDLQIAAPQTFLRHLSVLRLAVDIVGIVVRLMELHRRSMAPSRLKVRQARRQ